MVKSAYIHIPFCRSICSYCDFCKVIYNKKWINSYLDALENEIKKEYKGEILNTIYIGGGTPSSLDIDELKKLFDILKILKINNNYEYTIECNIEDITEEKLKLFKDNNINRISIGVETFNDKYLKYLNRSYKSDIINSKISLAKQYFDNINIDLIYALQNQTKEELLDDINKIKKLDINHISCYSLIIEDNTVLSINNTKPINEDLDYEMYKLIDDNLSDKYIHYEVSNYAKEGYESRANLTYWHNEEYYGFGISAAGYINNERYTNTKNLSKYINDNNIRDVEILTQEDKIKYELILGFRLLKGINKEKFLNKFNKNIKDIKNITKLINEGYLIEDDNNIYVNGNYIYVLNDILINFV
ncbi:MAG: radical SAM family heme chaperone HemW [Bacilli bacterium]|nr:radical SAM family heme chaperone HemW [Bacilli bacterium]